jgi:ABC-type transport system involved in cytochrome c biogenesis permease subunit
MGIALLAPLKGEEAPLDFRSFGRLAIQEDGRRKPVQTFANEEALRIAGSERVKAFGRVWVPEEFVLSVMLGTREWRGAEIVPVSNRELVKALGLAEGRKRFAFAELAAVPRLGELAREGAAFKERREEEKITRVHREAEALVGRMNLFARLESGEAFAVLPADRPGAAWRSPVDGAGHAGMGTLAAMLEAYRKGDGAGFSAAAEKLRGELRASAPGVYPSERVLDQELAYNRLNPFVTCAWIYGAAFVLLWLSRGGKLRWLGWAGYAAVAAAVGVHVAGIVLRCMIAGRPPVTNMYESVVWASLGTAVFGAIFAAVHRARIYLLAALPAAFFCLLLLSLLPSAMPGEINPLVPVLRDNFWLVVHVLTIVSSYAAFLLAWALGHVILWGYVRDPGATQKDGTIHRWLYRVLQLGILLLAAGTILGGVWANYSWGRFWGWDPKETWALIALLCYLFVLHGRLAGWWNQFGLAVASVVCFCAVLMTWYGVNFVLGKGLHSYGFGLGGEGYVYAAVAVDLVFVAVAAWRRGTLRRAV